MFHWCIAALAFLTVTLLLTDDARAEPPLRVPFLPSIVTPQPRSVFTAVPPLTRASATSIPAELTPVDHSFLARVARALDGLRPPVSARPRDAGPRNPTLPDPARERDATSFGIRSAKMSASGTIFAGFGLGAGAAQLIDLAKLAKKLPVTFGPTVCQGGGGITFKTRW